MAPGCADEDGWLHTGDLGRIDDEGFLYVEDRLGDVIVSGGENVLPAEVEEVLLRHPDVADAAAVGRADAEWQEAVEAVVVLRDGAAAGAAELRRHCAESLAGYKVPKRFEFVSELPAHRLGQALAPGAALVRTLQGRWRPPADRVAPKPDTFRPRSWRQSTRGALERRRCPVALGLHRGLEVV